MFLSKNITSCFRIRVNILAKLSSTQATTELTDTIVFKPKFTPEEEETILKVLNESDVKQIGRFDISQGRIKSLQSWRKKNGLFQSLSEVLEVNGLGEKVLERLCNSIICNKPKPYILENDLSTKKNNNLKNRKQVLFPPLDPDLETTLKNAVGIHFTPNAVSWAKLSCEQNELQVWNYHDYSSLPKKLLPTETFELATKLISEIPPADVYVMESPPSNGPSGSKAPLPTYTQQLELNSMLLALLNTSRKHNKSIKTTANIKEKDFIFENKVYYLRAHLPARLFKTLVGTERVAVTGIITKLLNGLHVLPCSTIKVDNQLMDQYTAQSTVHRDMMGQALLLVISFMDVCVYRNLESLQALLPSQRRL